MKGRGIRGRGHAASADTMTNYLPDGPESVGRTAGRFLPSGHSSPAENECVCALNLLGGAMRSGYQDVSDAACSEWACTDQRVLHSLQLLVRLGTPKGGRGSTFEAPSWQGLRPSGAFLRVDGRRVCASAVNAPKVVHICG